MIIIMITAGIDAGFESMKAVILRDGEIIGHAKAPSGGEGRAAAAKQALDEALAQAGVSFSDVEKIVSTGKGKHNIDFASDRITEPLSAARAAGYLCPGATAIVDVGADETLVAILKDDRASEMVINQKCAAGLGAFLSYMGRRLEISPEEMSALERPGPDSAAVNDGCVVFAELDALGLLNRGFSPREVAVAVTEIAAVRASSVLNDITVPRWEKTVLVGGLARNSAFVSALEVHTGLEFIVPAHAEYAGAAGAAVFAAQG